MKKNEDEWVELTSSIVKLNMRGFFYILNT